MTKAVINVNFDNCCKRCGEPGAEKRTGLCLKCIGDIVAKYQPKLLSEDEASAPRILKKEWK